MPRPALPQPCRDRCDARTAGSLKAFAPHHPVPVGAQAAGSTRESAAGGGIALELPLEPVHRDIGELTAARMAESAGVAAVVAGPIEHRHMIDRLEIGCRN